MDRLREAPQQDRRDDDGDEHDDEGGPQQPDRLPAAGAAGRVALHTEHDDDVVGADDAVGAPRFDRDDEGARFAHHGQTCGRRGGDELMEVVCVLTCINDSPWQRDLRDGFVLVRAVVERLRLVSGIEAVINTPVFVDDEDIDHADVLLTQPNFVLLVDIVEVLVFARQAFERKCD